MTAELSAERVQAALKTRWLGRPYHFYPVAASTNDLLKQWAAAGTDREPAAGTALLADYQSSGRGRLGRSWVAPAGSSLLLSILFRPDWPATQAHWLTMMASTAAAVAVERVCSLAVGVKWPNDLVLSVDGAWRKFSGLLLEGNINADGRFTSAVLGIGINVNIPPDQLPQTPFTATSLQAAVGRPVSRLELLLTFLERLEPLYEAAAAGRSPQTEWNRRLVMLGQEVEVTHRDGRLIAQGIAVGTNEWGQLLVRDNAGNLHPIAAGDVTLRSNLEKSSR
ncbi:MAG: biotin--[acetyl-CoA-carboxylase] ligase [Anaerolineae bacterium]